GARMALTHTASLAGSDELYDALFARLGVARVRSIPEFDETLKMLALGGIPQGRKLAILTNSGATRTLLADLGAEASLSFPPSSSKVAVKLRQQLPEFATVSNPLDYNAAYAGAEGLTMENEPALRDCFATMISDDYDIVLLSEDGLDSPEPADNLPNYPTLNAWIDAAAARGVPAAVITMLPEKFGLGYRQICVDHQVVPLQGLEDGIKAIETAIKMGEQRQQIMEETPWDSLLLPTIPMIDDQQGYLLDEAASKTELAKFGLPIPKFLVTTLADVQQMAEGLTFPLAVKALGSDLAHKSRLGGVYLGVDTSQALQIATETIERNLRQHNLVIDALLLEEMVTGARAELIIGVTYNSRFGHALLIGQGGVQVESGKPPTPLLLPVSEARLRRQVTTVITSLNLPLHTVAPVMKAVEAIVAFVEAHSRQLLELDVNPLIVYDDGHQAIAVDGVIRWVDDTEETGDVHG
ncbi:MAG: acetate--CoA ligase family protein, partial [Chloroflexota bacterium]